MLQSSTTANSRSFRRVIIASALCLTSWPCLALANESSDTRANAEPPVGSAGSSSSSLAGGASAKVQFDTSLLSGQNARAVDLTRFSVGNVPEPGNYRFDIYVNGAMKTRDLVRFDLVGEDIVYCVSATMIEMMDLDVAKIDADKLAKIASGACVQLPELVEGAIVRYDNSQLSLHLSIPQVAMIVRPRGYTDPAEWDDGVDAAMLAYNLNYFHAEGRGGSGYAGLNGGINLGPWRLRHRGTVEMPNSGRARYNGLETYVRRAIRPLRAMLILGDNYTDSSVYDSVRMRGVTLMSEDEMLPDSMRGYAPQIRGVARTNARVTVRQNGNIIFETTVAPGAFLIQDVYASSFGANLEVTVTEADGTSTVSMVPFASAPQLVRQGRLRYSINAGWLRNSYQFRHLDDPLMARLTAQYGLTDRMTIFGGATVTDGYQSGLLGLAVNTHIGAFSADLTMSNTDIPIIGQHMGHRLRLSYSNFITATRTNIAIAAFMQTSKHFWDLSDAHELQIFGGAYTGYGPFYRERRRFQLNVSQPLGDMGNLYLSGNVSSYWGRSDNIWSAQAGYSKMFDLGSVQLNADVNYSRSRLVSNGRQVDRVMGTLSIPFGSRKNRMRLHAQVIHDNDGGALQQLRLSGSHGVDNHINYSAYVQRNTRHTGGGADIQVETPFTRLNAGFSHIGNWQYSLGASGGVVLHSEGLSFTNQLGSTTGVVVAKGGRGARVAYGQTRVNGDGLAIVPYLTPYRANSIDIDVQGTSQDVHVRGSSVRVVPTWGAVSMLRYDTEAGRSAIFNIRTSSGKPIPFGSAIVDADGRERGLVGPNGRSFAAAIPDKGNLRVMLADGGAQQCSFNYALPASTPNGHAILDVVCSNEIQRGRDD